MYVHKGVMFGCSCKGDRLSSLRLTTPNVLFALDLCLPGMWATIKP